MESSTLMQQVPPMRLLRRSFITYYIQGTLAKLSYLVQHLRIQGRLPNQKS